MNRLDGHTILVAEDEPQLVSLDVASLLHDLLSTFFLASSVRAALAHADITHIAAAVLDINLVVEDCSPLCQRLSERVIPFMFYSCYIDAPFFKQCPSSLFVRKLANRNSIIMMLICLNYVLH